MDAKGKLDPDPKECTSRSLKITPKAAGRIQFSVGPERNGFGRQSWKFRHLSNNCDTSIVLDCIPVAGVSYSDHHHACDSQCTSTKSLQRQQRVIDRPELGKRDDK